MTISRRALLGTAGGLALGLGACSTGSRGSDQPGVELRMAWWGNQTRTDLTTKVIDRYQQATPGLTVRGQPAEWASHGDKLATQTAANDAPDVIQTDLKYLRQYGDRGALLALDRAGVTTAGFADGTVDPGRTPDGLMGVNAGVNVLLVAANPEVFDQVASSCRTTRPGRGSSGLTSRRRSRPRGRASSARRSSPCPTWASGCGCARRARICTPPTGSGSVPPDAQEWFELSRRLEQTKAIPPVGQSSEDIVAPVGDRLFTKGKTAMSVYWSNQVLSLEKASGADLTLLRFPSMTGKAADAELFSNVSMMWSVPARSQHTEAAAAFVNHLVNDPGSASALMAERGMPANTALRTAIPGDLNPSDAKAARYLASVEADLTSPSPAPAGLGDISLPQARFLQDVRFGRSDPATAAKAYVDELTTMLTG